MKIPQYSCSWNTIVVTLNILLYLSISYQELGMTRPFLEESGINRLYDLKGLKTFMNLSYLL